MEIPHRIYLSPHVRESRTVLDSGFHDVDSGFRVLDSGFQHSGFQIPKRAGFHFFPGFNAFLRTSFSCPNLGILKEVVRRHNKFVFFFDLQNALQFRKGLWYNNEGDIEGLSLPQHRRKNITKTASPQKNVAKHRHRNLKFCPTINLIQISM